MTNLNFLKADRTVMSPGLFRLALAAAVFLSHISALEIGGACVYLFFMLSGYWIWVMWFKEYAVLDRPWRIFIISRFWRLLPAYLATLFLLGLCVWPLAIYAYSLPTGFAWPTIHFYFAQLLLIGHAQLDFPNKLILTAWSLDPELQFYIVAPLLIAVLAAPKRRLLQAALFGGAALGLVVLLVDYELKATTGTLPLYLAFFLVGMATARYDWRPSMVQVRWSIGLAAFLVVGCVAIPATRALFLEGRFSGPMSDFNTLANVALAFIAAPYAMATVRQKGGAMDRSFGNISYEVYLLHGAAITVFDQRYAHMTRLAQLPYTAAMLAATVVLALLIYKFVDQPSEALRRTFVRKQRTRSQAEHGVSVAPGRHDRETSRAVPTP